MHTEKLERRIRVGMESQELVLPETAELADTTLARSHPTASGPDAPRHQHRSSSDNWGKELCNTVFKLFWGRHPKRLS